jgi:hypothetical protein
MAMVDVVASSRVWIWKCVRIYAVSCIIIQNCSDLYKCVAVRVSLPGLTFMSLCYYIVCAFVLQAAQILTPKKLDLVLVRHRVLVKLAVVAAEQPPQLVQRRWWRRRRPWSMLWHPRGFGLGMCVDYVELCRSMQNCADLYKCVAVRFGLP